MELKLTLTLFFILGFFFLKYTMRWANQRLKQNLTRKDPVSAEKFSWFFSNQRLKIQEGIFLAFIVILLILLWLGAIPVNP